jgi:hypothetical protein
LMVTVDGRAFPILWSIIGAARLKPLKQKVSGGAPPPKQKRRPQTA